MAGKFSSFYADYFETVKDNKNGWFDGRCPFPDHADRHESFGYNEDKGSFKCHGCGRKGSVIDFIMEMNGVTKQTAIQKIKDYLGEGLIERREDIDLRKRRQKNQKKEIERKQSKLPTSVEIQRWHEALLADDEKMEYLDKERGWSVEIIKKFLIGFHDGRYMIPVERDGDLVNVRRYMPKAKAKKVIGIYGWNFNTIYPEASLKEEVVWLMEGEPDALCALSAGLNAVTFTGGAKSIPTNQIGRFRDHTVYICYDADEAGAEGAIKAASAIRKRGTIRLKVLTIRPLLLPDEKDFSDLVFRVGASKARSLLESLVKKTAWFAPEKDNLATRFECGIEDAVNAGYVGRTITLEGTILGMAQHPYLVARSVRASCRRAGEFDECDFCALKRGSADWGMDYLTDEPLVQIKIKKTSRLTELRRLIGIRCKRHDPIEDKDMRLCRLDELMITNHVSAMGRMDRETSMVTRNVFCFAQDEPFHVSSSYAFTGTAVACPWDQSATNVFLEADRLQGSVESFNEDDPEIRDSLKIFRVEESFVMVHDDDAGGLTLEELGGVQNHENESTADKSVATNIVANENST